MKRFVFEWDTVKASANQRKHRISFEEAVTVFDDPFALIVSDDSHSTKEEIREWLIGTADFGVIVVVFTIRPARHTARIISARPASRKERDLYEEAKRISI